MSCIIHNHIEKGAKLPFRKIKGSYQKRIDLAENLSNKFYNNLIPNIQNRSCNICDLYESLNETFKPTRINYEIRSTEEKVDAGRIACLGNLTKVEYDKGLKHLFYNGYFFKFPMDKNKKSITNISVICHEVRHLIDNLVHPKFLVRGQAIVEKQKNVGLSDLLRDIFLEDIDSKYHADMDHIDIVTRMILQPLDNRTAVDFLQDVRYSLLSEIFAYNTEIKTLKLMNQKDKAKKVQDFVDNDYILKQKLAYVTKKIKEILTTERKNQKQKVNKSNL